jgi:hypothetical protein
MTDIKELALKVAKDIGYWDEQEEYILDFATRLIAAYKAMNAALEIVTTDRCDGDSAFASGVNAACERHAIGIRSIIEGVKK